MYRARGWALASLNTIEQCVASGQTQDSLIAGLERGDGCQMHGYLEVNKVAGNVHFAPGKSFQHAHMHIHDLAAFPANKFNVSHVIDSISFGSPYPGLINPLDQSERILGPDDGGGMYMYYIKVVPTTYDSLGGTTLSTNQFSVTEHFRSVTRDGQGLPGVFFFYELRSDTCTLRAPRMLRVEWSGGRRWHSQRQPLTVSSSLCSLLRSARSW